MASQPPTLLFKYLHREKMVSPLSFINTHYRTFSILSLAVGLIWIFISADPKGYASHSGSAPRPGFSAPDFTLVDTNGKEVNLADFQGFPVMVNFWASWCSPCQAEMPTFQKIYAEYAPQGFVILAINNQEGQKGVLDFVKAKAITFPVLLDPDGAISDQYRVNSLPTTFFIGRDGEIMDILFGGPVSEAYLRIQVHKLLQEAP